MLWCINKDDDWSGSLDDDDDDEDDDDKDGIVIDDEEDELDWARAWDDGLATASEDVSDDWWLLDLYVASEGRVLLELEFIAEVDTLVFPIWSEFSDEAGCALELLAVLLKVPWITLSDITLFRLTICKVLCGGLLLLLLLIGNGDDTFDISSEMLLLELLEANTLADWCRLAEVSDDDTLEMSSEIVLLNKLTIGLWDEVEAIGNPRPDDTLDISSVIVLLNKLDARLSFEDDWLDELLELEEVSTSWISLDLEPIPMRDE